MAGGYRISGFDPPRDYRRLPQQNRQWFPVKSPHLVRSRVLYRQMPAQAMTPFLQVAGNGKGGSQDQFQVSADYQPEFCNWRWRWKTAA